MSRRPPTPEPSTPEPGNGTNNNNGTGFLITPQSMPRVHRGRSPASPTRVRGASAEEPMILSSDIEGEDTDQSESSSPEDTPASRSRKAKPSTPRASSETLPEDPSTIIPITSWTSDAQAQGDKRSTNTRPTDTPKASEASKRPRLFRRREDAMADVPPKLPGSKLFPPDDPIVPQTSFAPPYKSVFLRQRPELAKLLAHVNCSYLTTHNGNHPLDYDGRANTAPSLVELKKHAKALLVLIRELSVGGRACMIDNAAFRKSVPEGQDPSPLTGDFFDGLGAWDFINDLSIPYVNKEPSENVPLTHLLNQLRVHLYPGQKAEVVMDVCPLTLVKPVRQKAGEPLEFQPGVNPLPHSQINLLMEHANELLLQIDNALSSSGGLLAALPLDLPDSDPRRKTYIGQLIHFMRVLVGRVHVLDRDYGQALDLLAGEATVPMEMKLNLKHAHELERAFVSAQHQYILNTNKDTYDGIWEHLRAAAPEASFRESNGMGLLDITLTTRYRALRGGKTIFITPIVKEVPPSQAVGRPTVVACPKPGFSTRTSEWERKHGAALIEAKSWEMRANAYEAENQKLRADIDALEPETVWHDGEKTKLLDLWDKLTVREDLFEEEKRRAKMYAERNNKMDLQMADLKRENELLKRQMEKRAAKLAESGIAGMREQNKQLAMALAESNGKLSKLPGNEEEMEKLVAEHGEQRKKIVQLQGDVARARREGGGKELQRLEGEIAVLKYREGVKTEGEVKKLRKEVEYLTAQLVSMTASRGRAGEGAAVGEGEGEGQGDKERVRELTAQVERLQVELASAKKG